MKTKLLLLFFCFSNLFAGNIPQITEAHIFEPTAKGLEIVLKGDKQSGFSIDALMKVRVIAPPGVPVRLPVAALAKLEVVKVGGKLVGESVASGIATTAENRGTYFYFAPTGKGKFVTFGKSFRLGVLAEGEYEVKISEFYYQIGGSLYTYKPATELFKKKFEIPK